jgi:hypothetical protein
MSVCVDNSFCLAVGKHRQAILRHFKFKHFQYVTEIKRINSTTGANGLIHLLAYEHSGYDACAVLKSSTDETADNLLYEFIVGLFINKLNQTYRCFIETFGIYTYATRASYDHFKALKQMNVAQEDLTNHLKPMLKVDMVGACRNPTATCILIQCLPDTKSLYDKMGSDEFVRDHLHVVLYQIYYVLAKVAGYFTHYDLHLDNILIMYLPEKTHFSYGVSFESRHLAKIIDYGRCFFNDPSSKGPFSSSPDFYKLLCNECNHCGENNGFNWFKTGSSKYYLNSTKHNQSHDLLALSQLRNLFGKRIKSLNPRLHALLQKLNYEKDFGTPHLLLKNNRINSVFDAGMELEKLMRPNRKTRRA